MKRILLGVLGFLLLFQTAATAESLIQLKNGTTATGSFRFENGTLTFHNGTAIPAREIQQILIHADSGSSPAASESAQSISRPLGIASAAAAFIARFPDAGGILLADELTYRYLPNDTHTLRVYFLGQVLKEDHKSWADQVFYYTEGRDRVQVKTARCIQPDGTVITADPATFKIAKPQMSPGVFLKYLQLSFRIPGVDIGSLVEVEYEIETYNPYRPEFFFPINYFQSQAPVFNSRLTISVPESKTVFWDVRNFPKELETPLQMTANGVKQYIWERQEMAPIVPEPYMPPGGDGIPYVQASLFEGWEKINDWILAYWKPNTTPTPELASQAAEIVKGLTTEDEKVAKIYHWVQKNIRYIIIKGDAATVYGSYPAQETVQKQFGCCVDKAMVFAALLNAVGIKNGPLLINAGGHEMSRRIPNLNISHAISRVTRPDGSTYYLDSTNYDFRYPSMPTMNQGKLVLDPFNGSMDEVPLQKPEENMFKLVASLTLSADGTITSVGKRTMTGEMEVGVRQWMKSMKPREREEAMLTRINGYGQGARLLALKLENLEDIERPLGMELHYSLASYPRAIADLQVFKIPGFLEGLKFSEAALATRTYPIEYESTEARVEMGVLEIPAGWRIRSLPEDLQLTTPFFEFTGGYVKQSDRVLAFSGAFRRLAKRVPLAEYPAYKEALNRIERFSRQQIFLVRETAP